MNQSFHSAYTSPPVVYLSTSHLYVKQQHHTEFGIQLLSVDVQGFSMRCGSGGGTQAAGNLVQDLEVQWISVPV